MTFRLLLSGLDTVEVRYYLRPGGSANGFPFVLENGDLVMELGEFNMPSFRVRFRSESLWHSGAAALHQWFTTWAEAVGFHAIQPESLSRE